jgi:energy-coupling factor transporter transmembrane protein EcfT
MWILSFLPDWLFHIVVIVGILGVVASFFFSFIPFISQYKLPIQVISIIILIFGVFFEGAISNNNSWLLKVKEMEKRIAQAETQSAEANGKLISEIAKKQQELNKVQDELKKRIRDNSDTINAECKISNNTIGILNDAAKGTKK